MWVRGKLPRGFMRLNILQPEGSIHPSPLPSSPLHLPLFLDISESLFLMVRHLSIALLSFLPSEDIASILVVLFHHILFLSLFSIDALKILLHPFSSLVPLFCAALRSFCIRSKCIWDLSSRLFHLIDVLKKAYIFLTVKTFKMLFFFNFYLLHLLFLTNFFRLFRFFSGGMYIHQWISSPTILLAFFCFPIFGSLAT